jgi:hypothetical protein
MVERDQGGTAHQSQHTKLKFPRASESLNKNSHPYTSTRSAIWFIHAFTTKRTYRAVTAAGSVVITIVEESELPTKGPFEL